MNAIAPLSAAYSLVMDIFSIAKSKRKQIDGFSKKLLCDALFPQFFEEPQLTTILLKRQELQERFYRLLILSASVKQIRQEGEVLDCAESLIFIMKGRAKVLKLKKKFKKINPLSEQKINIEKQNRGKKTEIQKIEEFEQFMKIPMSFEDEENNIRVEAMENSQLKVLIVNRSEIERFRIQLMKDEYEMKKKFLNTYLFCGHSPIYSIKTLSIQIYDKVNTNITLAEDRIQILYEGTILSLVNQGKQLKYQSQLAKGSILSMETIKTLLSSNGKSRQFNCIYKSRKCKIISMVQSEFHKIVRNNENIARKLLIKIENCEKNRNAIIRKSQAIQQKNKVQLSPSIQLNIGIVIRKSKAFRIKSQLLEEELNRFMSMNKYQRMTKSKQNVQRKLNYFSQLQSINKELKCQMEVKNEKTQQRMKEKKQKNIKNLRLKKNKIESIAIKQSITNTGRYRNKPASVKFIFEDEVNENEMKEEYKIRKNHKKCSTQCKSQQVQHQQKKVKVDSFKEDKEERRNDRLRESILRSNQK